MRSAIFYFAPFLSKIPPPKSGTFFPPPGWGASTPPKRGGSDDPLEIPGGGIPENPPGLKMRDFPRTEKYDFFEKKGVQKMGKIGGKLGFRT